MSTHSPAGTAPGDALDANVLKVASVVVLGAVMAILDGTVVNVAFQKLSIDFATSFDVIQWVSTAYLLALVTVIPVTGWAADRFGTKRLYILAIVLFLIGSMLAGVAWNIETMIGFRVLQGLGGGVLMPAGMTIVTRAAGPQRLGRVMAVLGVPMLLGPIAGPIFGGWLVDAVSWRWVFFINVPFGLLALVLAWRVLPADTPEPGERFDFVGMLLVSPGLSALIFGVSKVPSAGGFGAAVVWLPMVVGLALLTAFVLRALRVPNPLVDLKLFRDRTFTVAMLTMSLYFVAFIGGMMLLPTYFLLVRGESTLHAGLLLTPQGIGAMITIPITGKLADRIGARKIVLPGLIALVAAMSLLTQLTPTTPYPLLMAALFVIGLGVGCTMMPVTTAALQTLRPKDMARASSATNIVQQTAGAIGSAVMATILAALLATRFAVPTAQGQLAATAAIADPETRTRAAALASDAFSTTFTWAVALVVLCLLPALFLPKTAPEPLTAPATAH